MSSDSIESRCFPNPLAEAEAIGNTGKVSKYSSPLEPTPGGPTEAAGGAPALRQEVQKTLLEALDFYATPLLEGGAKASDAWCRTSCCSSSKREGGPSVYIGRAGLDWALLQLQNQGVQCASRESLSRAPWLISEADKDVVEQPECANDCSLLCGSAGVWFVLSMRSLMRPHAAPQQQSGGGSGDGGKAVKTFLRFCSFAVENATEHEWLYGRTGLLIGLLLLSHELQKHEEDPNLKALASECSNTIDAMAGSIIAAGERAAAADDGSTGGPPLRYKWHGKEYVGAAHGYIGILYALLLVPSIRSSSPQHPTLQKIKATIEWVLMLETAHSTYPAVFESGEFLKAAPWVHFCHGAPGAVYLFAEAFAVFKEEAFRLAGERAAGSVWRYGLLRNGPCLCHGVAGNAYALLRWYQVSEQVVWLERAVRFAEELNEDRQKTVRRDHPFSLFEGHAGVCCFLSDLLHDPLKARFPVFGV